MKNSVLFAPEDYIKPQAQAHSTSTLGIHTGFCMATPSSLEIYNQTHKSLSNQDMKFHRHSLYFAKQQSCQTIHLELIRNETNGWCRNTEKYKESTLSLVSLGIWRLVRVNWSHTVVGNTAGITGSSWPRFCSPLTCFPVFQWAPSPISIKKDSSYDAWVSWNHGCTRVKGISGSPCPASAASIILANFRFFNKLYLRVRLPVLFYLRKKEIGVQGTSGGENSLLD